jgi:predicted peptidase
MRSALVATLLLLMSCRTASMTETGFLNRETSADGVRYPYVVYVPRNWTPARRWPVVLFLHGAGERGLDGLQATQIGVGAAIRANPERIPAIVVFPQAPPDQRWIGPPADAAIAALARSVEEFSGDPDRLYLTGLSLGGYGSWHLALAHPDLFAAIAPVCGGIIPNGSTTSTRRSPLTAGAADPYAFTATALRHLPTWIFHGADDTIVLPSESRKMHEALVAAGANVQYTEFPHVGHNAWDAAYGNPDFWEWLFAQHRVSPR